MVNPDVEGCTKTIDHRKVLRKTKKTTTILKNKRILKPKY